MKYNSSMKQTILVTDKDRLAKLIDIEVSQYGNDCNLNHIDTSSVTDMDGLFAYSNFNGDIFNWDVSSVTDMNALFYNSQFNGDISRWDVSNVLFMHDLFLGSSFKGDTSCWRPLNLDSVS